MRHLPMFRRTAWQEWVPVHLTAGTFPLRLIFAALKRSMPTGHSDRHSGFGRSCRGRRPGNKAGRCPLQADGGLFLTRWENENADRALPAVATIGPTMTGILAMIGRRLVFRSKRGDVV
jgi:hypothetical protein